MKFVLFVILVFALVTCDCTDADTTKRIAEAHGFKDVKITGYKVYGCEKGETYHTGFKAVGADGKPVSGVVCGGVFKSSTLRLD